MESGYIYSAFIRAGQDWLHAARIDTPVVSPVGRGDTKARLCAAPFSARVPSAGVLLLVDSTMLLILLWAHLLKFWISRKQPLKCALLGLFNLAASFLWALLGFEIIAGRNRR